MSKTTFWSSTGTQYLLVAVMLSALSCSVKAPTGGVTEFVAPTFKGTERLILDSRNNRFAYAYTNCLAMSRSAGSYRLQGDSILLMSEPKYNSYTLISTTKGACRQGNTVTIEVLDLQRQPITFKQLLIRYRDGSERKVTSNEPGKFTFPRSNKLVAITQLIGDATIASTDIWMEGIIECDYLVYLTNTFSNDVFFAEVVAVKGNRVTSPFTGKKLKRCGGALRRCATSGSSLEAFFVEVLGG